MTDDQQRNADIARAVEHALNQKDVDSREWQQEIAELRAALDRYVCADDCEYGDGPPCPGDVGVPQCMYCQACAALAGGQGQKKV